MFWHRFFLRLAQAGSLLALMSFFAFFPCGGMTIRGDEEGMWLLVGPEKQIAAAVLCVGVVVSCLASHASGLWLPPEKQVAAPGKQPTGPKLDR